MEEGANVEAEHSLLLVAASSDAFGVAASGVAEDGACAHEHVLAVLVPAALELELALAQLVLVQPALAHARHGADASHFQRAAVAAAAVDGAAAAAGGAVAAVAAVVSAALA